jgi:hypothetical protein
MRPHSKGLQERQRRKDAEQRAPRLNVEQFAEAAKNTIAFMHREMGLNSLEILSVADVVTNTIGTLMLEQSVPQTEPVRKELLAMVDRQKIRFQLWPQEPQQDGTM